MYIITLTVMFILELEADLIKTVSNIGEEVISKRNLAPNCNQTLTKFHIHIYQVGSLTPNGWQE